MLGGSMLPCRGQEAPQSALPANCRATRPSVKQLAAGYLGRYLRPMKRRTFLARGAAVAGVAALGPRIVDAQSAAVPTQPRPLGPPPPPISDDERRSRIEKARKLMVDNGISAIF